MHWVYYNGAFFDAAVPVLCTSNKGYRYGDGFFETIRVHKSDIPLRTFHQNRIGRSLALLGYQRPHPFSMDVLFENVLELCRRNHCTSAARVRMSFTNGGDTLFDAAPLNVLIEAAPLSTTLAPESDLVIGVYDEISKTPSHYSELKLAGGFIYSRSAQFAKVHGWDESLILNGTGDIAESTISNLFWIKDGTIFTPPLGAGCVNGVYRSFLITTESLIQQQTCSIAILQQADEIFLTNAVRGIRSVKRFGAVQYVSHITRAMWSRHQALLFP